MKFLRQSLVGVFLAALTLALLIHAGQTVMNAVQERMNREVRAPQARERKPHQNARFLSHFHT